MLSHCERSRRWVSLDLDGELSELERGLLDRHLRDCGECRRFAGDNARFTFALRSAAPELAASLVRLPAGPRRRRSAEFVAVVVAAAAMGASLIFVHGTAVHTTSTALPHRLPLSAMLAPVAFKDSLGVQRVAPHSSTGGDSLLRGYLSASFA
jgi:predicted anti-sigma-YlaC factor YlaD